jgi:lysophospholipase L1-like esterase
MVSGSLLFSLVILEMAARALHLGSGGFWKPHPLYGWENIPNARGWESCYGECEVYVEINSHGLRDYDYPYAKPSGVQRILFLGDSLTAAMQVPLEATFVKILEQKMGGGWEAINAGVNAFGTDNELIFYRQEASKYEPDIVVLGIYLANDVYNNHYELETRLGGSGHKPYFTLDAAGGLVLNNFPVESADTFSTRFVGWLNQHFQLPRFLAQTLNLRKSVPDALKPLVALAAGNRGAEEAAQDDAPGTASDTSPRANICQTEYAPVITEAWDITKAIILALRTEVEASGAELVVLVIPAAPQAVVPQEGRQWYCDQPNIELANFLDAEGIPYLDMLDAFRQHAVEGGAPLYYDFDFHMTAAGHALAGELLGAYFAER